jgi:putative ABC transport system ATP-binding protein
MPQPIISARKVTQTIQINQQNLTILKEIDLDIYQESRLQLRDVQVQESQHCWGF